MYCPVAALKLDYPWSCCVESDLFWTIFVVANWVGIYGYIRYACTAQPLGVVFGYGTLRQVLWFSGHNLCCLGRRQTLAIIISQFGVCYDIKFIFIQLLDMILPYRQFDCASAITEKHISNYSFIFLCTSLRTAPFNYSTDCKLRYQMSGLWAESIFVTSFVGGENLKSTSCGGASSTALL